jgi:hypothetical protein
MQCPKISHRQMNDEITFGLSPREPEEKAFKILDFLTIELDTFSL